MKKKKFKCQYNRQKEKKQLLDSLTLNALDLPSKPAYLQ